MANKLHSLVLTTAQMDAVRDGLELLKNHIDWSAGNLQPPRGRVDALRNTVSDARYVIGPYKYRCSLMAPACERNGCPYLPSPACSGLN